MVEAETHRCHTSDHPEFQLNCDDSITSRLCAPWLVGWLEERVSAGERFRAGETIQIGWMFDEIFLRPNGCLGIREPDFKAVPVCWSDTVALTLRHLWYQREIARSVSLAPSFPSYRQTAVVCTRVATAPVLWMERTEPEALDSGRFIGCYGSDHDHQSVAELGAHSLFEIAVTVNQRFIGYAALPTGCQVVLGPGRPLILLRSQPLDFVPGSLLAKSLGQA